MLMTPIWKPCIYNLVLPIHFTMVSLIIVSKYIHVNCTIPLSIAGGPMIGGEMGPSYSQHDPVSDTNVHPGMLHCHDKVKSTIV